MENDTNYLSTTKRFVIPAVVGSLLLALVLYFVPWPTHIEFQAPCVEVDRQGNVLNDGELVLTGWYYNYLFQRDTFVLEHLELPNVEIESTVDFDSGPPEIMYGPKGTDFIWIPCGFYAKDTDDEPLYKKMQASTIFTYPDFPYLVFEFSGTEDPRYFIGTASEDPNYPDILKEFYLYQAANTD